MSSIVHVRHPVPVRHRLRRGMRERIALAQAVAPVRLPEASAEEFVEVLAGSDGMGPLAIHKGRLWTPLAAAVPPYGKYTRPVPRAEFLAWLEGSDGAGLNVSGSLYRTPLLARHPDADVVSHHASRGGEVKDAVLSAAVDDQFGECRENVLRFLDEEVRLVGEMVYVRAPAPMADNRLDLVAHPRLHWATYHACRLDRMDDFKRHSEVRFTPTAEVRRVLGRLPASVLEDDDIHIFCNEAPAMALEYFRGDLEREPKAGDIPHHLLKGLAASLRPWVARGLVGGVGADSHEEVLAQLVAVIEPIRAAYPRVSSDLRVGGILSYARDYAMPRVLALRPVAPGDADALGGLAPGGL